MNPSSQLAPAHAPSDVDIPSTGNQEPAGHPYGVCATARIRAAHNGRATALPQLLSDGPFHLRRMRTAGKAATVGITGAMNAPLGGDRLTLDITAEDQAELEVTTAAAMLALRGPTTEAATYDVRLTAGEHAHLRRLPQPFISAADSNLQQAYTVELAATSRFVLREEQLLVVDPRLDVRRDAVLLGEGTKNGCAVLAPRQAARHCSPPPSRQPPRLCGNCSTRHTPS